MALATAGVGCSSWPTPTASDAGYVPDLLLENGSIRIVSPQSVAASSGGQYPLCEAARAWTMLRFELKLKGWTPSAATFPSSLPARVSYKLGIGSSMRTLMPNPQFYELVMGWPIGWTAPGAPVTGYQAWLQRARGQFSRLLTDWPMDADPSS